MNGRHGQLPDGFVIDVPFAMKGVAAGASGTVKTPVTFAGRITEVRVRVYQGNQQSMQVNPVVIAREQHNNVLSYPANAVAQGLLQWVAGDSLDDRFAVDYAVNLGDEIAVDYSNIDAVNAYDFAVTFTVVKGA